MPQTLKIEVLRNLTSTWRRCREQYPGWIIAPADARETLWSYTENWLDALPNALPRMHPSEALLLIGETMWRVDTSLCPLYVNQAEMATAVLSRVNPAPNVLAWPSDANLIGTGEASNSDLLAAWVGTAFSVMREAREDFDIDRFDLWRQRLERVSRERPNWLARWHYEHCLMSLWRLDFDALESALEVWPAQLEQLPFWEVKRAALWAELGDVSRAETLAESALDAIRGRMAPNVVDYRKLSEEGWAMRLLMTLRHSRAERMPESERARFQQRFSALARYKCNPWEITDWLELALKGPRPTVLRAESENLLFDPGTYSRSFSQQRHGPTEAARPAFAFLRVVEEAGLPLRVGLLMTLTQETKQIPLWIAPFAFAWAVATAIRADEEDVVEQLLDRANIGILKQSRAVTLANWLMEVCERSLRKLEVAKNRGWDRPLPQRILGAVAEGLSRLVLRVEPAGARRILTLAEEMCRIKSPESFFGVMKHIDAIFRRSIEWCMTREELMDRVVNWLELPLPSELGGREELHQDRAEPFDHIKIDGKARWKRTDEVAETRRINELLEAVSAGSPSDRRRASLRLVVVARLHGLSKMEVRRLKRALWARLEQDTNLPIHTGVRLTALLRYSPFPEKEWKARVKRAFLELAIPRIRTPNADGKGFSVDQWSAARRIKSLHDVTLGLWTPADERRFSVDWTSGEAAILISRITQWWEAEKSAFPESQLGRILVIEPITSCAEDLVHLLGDGLLLQLPQSKGASALSLLDSMAASGINVLPARPAATRLGMGVHEVASAILAGILSTTPVEVRTASRSFQNWLMLKKKYDSLWQPAEILDAIVWKIAIRRSPDLDTIMNVLAYMIGLRTICLSHDQIERLTFGLKLLMSETASPQELSIPFLTTQEYGSIPYAERPNHRLAASRLARELERYLRRSKKKLPEVIAEWRTTSRESALPELRKIWHQSDANGD